MADINNIAEEYSRIISELEKNITDVESLEYAKAKLSEMFMLFLEKIDGLTNEYETRLEHVANNQREIDQRVQKVENVLKGIEKEIYEESIYDFEIICPYCNNEFVIEFGEAKLEIECPECKNVIELDWDGEFGECDEEQGGCDGHCCGHHHKEDEDEDDNL